MLRNWPHTGTPIRLLEAVSAGNQRFPAGTHGVLSRLLIEKRAYDLPDDRVEIQIGDNLITVPRRALEQVP